MSKPRKGEVARVYIAWINAGGSRVDQAKRAATAQHELAEAQAKVAECRNLLICKLVAEGRSHAEVGELIGLSKTRVRQFLLAADHT